MDAARCREWWFGLVSELCKVIQHASSIHEVYEHLRDSTSTPAKNNTTAGLKQVSAVLANYFGMKPVNVMDGASSHKLTDPCYVPLHGLGGLCGPGCEMLWADCNGLPGPGLSFEESQNALADIWKL